MSLPHSSDTYASSAAKLSEDSALPSSDALVIPLVREELEIHTQQIVTGTVSIRKVVHEREEFVEEPGKSFTFDVERVPINRKVAELPTVRQEGETTIYPVAEEVLVVTKQYVLKEEVRVTRRLFSYPMRQSLLLRREELLVDREEGLNKTERS